MELLESMRLAYQTISQVLVDFSSYDKIIHSLPDEYKKDFLLENIYSKMDSLEPVYDFQKMDALLAVVTEAYVVDELKKQRDDQMELYARFSKFSNVGFLEEQLKSTAESIEDMELEIRDLRESIHSNNEAIKENNRSLDVYKDLFETFTNHDSLVVDVAKMEKEWKTYSENTKEIREELNRLELLKRQIKDIQDMIDGLKQKLTQYLTISSELKTYKKVYDEMIYVKESLSSTKGIPLRYIKNYLGNIEEIANGLLDIAFNGSIYLDKFRITQSEFSIPFYNRGRLLSDVKLASQGESAFISIALSFALSAQTMQEYNIMLLDEIDSALDMKHREKFLAILENQMNRMNTEQCFFITHGDMFSSYPVDVISIVPNDEYTGTIEIQKF
jgi:DNA repair exonuclease SbcCD ATPase subunit